MEEDATSSRGSQADDRAKEVQLSLRGSSSSRSSVAHLRSPHFLSPNMNISS